MRIRKTERSYWSSDVETFETDVVSAEQAAQILKDYPPEVWNRKLKEKRWKEYGQDMRDGHWCGFTSVLSFDIEGVPLNGFNRLYAQERFNVSAEHRIQRGCPSYTREYFDRGCGRTVADTWKMHDRNGDGNKATNVNAQTTIARTILQWEKGILDSGRVPVTRDEINSFLDKEWERVSPVVKFYQYLSSKGVDRKLQGKNVLAAAFFIARTTIDEYVAEEFFVNQIGHGYNISFGMAAHALRTKVRMPENGKKDLALGEVQRLVAHAWNKHRNAEEVRSLVAPRTLPLMR